MTTLQLRANVESAPKPRNDAYTGLLFISFVALVTSSILLFLDYNQYGGKTPPKLNIPALGQSPIPTVPGAYTSEEFVMPWGELFLKGLRLSMGIGNIQSVFDETISLIGAGQLKPGKLFTHQLGLSEAAEAYRLMDKREALKVVLDPAR